MATAVANVASVPATSSTDATQTTRSTSRTNSTDPFQTVLAEARSGVRRTQPADNVRDTLPLDPVEADASTDDADDTTSDLGGVLAAVAQGVLPSDTPVNFAQAELLTSGQSLTASLNGVTPQLDSNPTAPPTRSNPLFRQFVSEASPRNNTQLTPTVAQPATTPVAPTTTPVVAQTAAATPPAVIETLTPPAALAAAVTSVQPAQRQVVPAQAPLVAGVLPNAAQVVADDLPDPVVAPQEIAAPAALPGVLIGDRPANAGEQFAAIASTASTLTPAAATTPANTTTDFAATAAPVFDAANATNTTALNTASVTEVASSDAGREAITASLPAATGATSGLLANATFVSLPAEGTALINASLLPPPVLKPGEISSDADRDRSDVTSTFGTAPAPTTSNVPAASSSATRAPEAAPTPTPATQIADSIVTHAAAVEHAGATEFRMRLDPPELGPVRVRLIASGDSIHGQVVVSDDAVRRMIESQLPELRQRLEAAGVNVQTFDVATDAGTGTGGGRNGYRTEGTELAWPGASAGTADTGRTRPSGPRAAGVLDVTV